MDVSQALREQIWILYMKNMKDLLEHSSFGWDRSEKELEWFHPHSRIMTIIEANKVSMHTRSSRHSQPLLLACGIFRFDTEENEEDGMDEVLYCYELQVSENAQRQGLGLRLLELMEIYGSEYRMKKVMLTSLKENTTALSFYSKRGYTNDPICPTNWIDEDEDQNVDYVILSKMLSKENQPPT